VRRAGPDHSLRSWNVRFPERLRSANARRRTFRRREKGGERTFDPLLFADHRSDMDGHEPQRPIVQSRRWAKAKWLTCVVPPVAVIALEETPGLSDLDGINTAGLIVLSPFAVALGFAITALIALFTRWIGSAVGIRNRVACAALMLTFVGLLSPLAYMDKDWLLLGVIEMASLPAAIVLSSASVPKSLEQAS
jgi:hypothetical protein